MDAEITQGAGGVWIYLPGKKLAPRKVPGKAPPRHCGLCGHGPVGAADRYACSPMGYFYECPECVDPERLKVGFGHRWKEAKPS